MFSPGRRIRNRSNFSSRNASRPRYSPYAYEEWIILTDSDSDDGPPTADVYNEEEEVISQATTEEEEGFPDFSITDIASPRKDEMVRLNKTPNLELALAVNVVTEKGNKAADGEKEVEDVAIDSAKSAKASKGEECIPFAPTGDKDEPAELQTKDFLIGWG